MTRNEAKLKLFMTNRQIEAKVNEHLKDSPYSFETKVVKESKIVGVIDA